MKNHHILLNKKYWEEWHSVTFLQISLMCCLIEDVWILTSTPITNPLQYCTIYPLKNFIVYS